MSDVLITPASSKIEFKDASNNIDGIIELDASGNLKITAPNAGISLGDTVSDIYIGDGVNNIDIVFEQNGEIRALTGKTLTLGQADSNVTVAANLNVNSDISSFTGAVHFGGGLIEKFENAGTTLALQTNNPLSDGNVILFTGNESGNTTINFTGVHSALAQGESVSFTAIITPNGSGVINAVQVDGVAQTVQWSGGSVPSAGSSGRDVYTFTLLKNGTTTTSYLVFGAATNYA